MDIAGFSLYTVMAGTRPAAFTISDLAVTPAQVPAGRRVTISVRVTNDGDLSGQYEVTPRLDGEPVGTKQVTLAGRTSETASFSVAADAAGIHVIEVGDLSATFEVTGATTPAGAPAAFSVSDLTITPSEVIPGGTVDISVRVANAGDLAGDYEVRLFVDGTAVETRVVTLAGHSVQTVSFSTTAGMGTSTVKIGELSGTFKAIAPPATGTVAAAPALTVSDIKVTPDRVKEGEPVAISAVVSNPSDKTLSQDIVLKINGINTSTQAVTLAAGADQPVGFNITGGTAGFYIARIGDATASFEVGARPAAIRWLLILIVVGAVVIIGAVLWFGVFAKKKE